ncbi:MAG: EscU/YscU/HrcU family type III secretion system export apparatus switch protein [Lutispora sp.]|nr:EscU/YscU/HrcU family type III secretion system export apparatus switch protein [Lutispora sp.]
MKESKNCIKKAAALTYEKGYTAPKISAAGKGIIAENIIKAAKKNNVPVFENKDLVDNLLNFELGSEIPPELYVVVAEVLAFVSHIDRMKGEKNV